MNESPMWIFVTGSKGHDGSDRGHSIRLQLKDYKLQTYYEAWNVIK